MQGNRPSVTAHWAAAHRAIHQKLENGAIFFDPFACAIIGQRAVTAAEEVAADPAARPIRLFTAARSRFAEDALSIAVSRGLRQVVVLGAGLDTFALRNPYARLGLRVFEADHPATQAWKRERLASAGLAVPESLTFVPIDFERESLADALTAAGFTATVPAFFICLGVVPYLTSEAIGETLRFIASVADSEVVFDYSEPFENCPPGLHERIAAFNALLAAAGEPWLNYIDPVLLARELDIIGYTEIEDLGPAEMDVRFFGVPEGEATGGPGPHVIRARR
jgi:methyltransferase (TIGR00027 family)